MCNVYVLTSSKRILRSIQRLYVGIAGELRRERSLCREGCETDCAQVHSCSLVGADQPAYSNVSLWCCHGIAPSLHSVRRVIIEIDCTLREEKKRGSDDVYVTKDWLFIYHEYRIYVYICLQFKVVVVKSGVLRGYRSSKSQRTKRAATTLRKLDYLQARTQQVLV
jgi:hypothetical protein